MRLRLFKRKPKPDREPFEIELTWEDMLTLDRLSWLLGMSYGETLHLIVGSLADCLNLPIDNSDEGQEKVELIISIKGVD